MVEVFTVESVIAAMDAESELAEKAEAAIEQLGEDAFVDALRARGYIVTDSVDEC